MKGEEKSDESEEYLLKKFDERVGERRKNLMRGRKEKEERRREKGFDEKEKNNDV